MTTIAIVARNWMSVMRVIDSASSPKSWTRGAGKNSSIEGPWNSGPSPAEVAIRVAVWVNSAGSSFGAPAENRGDDGR
jgi:hypothetical protein